MQQLLATIKESQQLSEWFDDSNICYTERNISFPGDNGDVEHRRPDRIVRRNNGEMIIIDFKFGYSQNPKTIAKHTSQVREYMHLMNRLGETRVKGYVWYARL